jgi:hypothetical protein
MGEERPTTGCNRATAVRGEECAELRSWSQGIFAKNVSTKPASWRRSSRTNGCLLPPAADMAAALAGAAMCDKRKFCDLTDLKCLSITSIVRRLQTLRPRWSRHVVSPLALALLLLPAPALAGIKEKVAALAPPALVLVMDAKGNELLAQNTDEPFVPASVTKIVTAWLAMEVLGGTTALRPASTWRASNVADGEPACRDRPCPSWALGSETAGRRVSLKFCSKPCAAAIRDRSIPLPSLPRVLPWRRTRQWP